MNKDEHVEEELGPKFLDMYSSIYAMRQELDRIRKPIGSRENPARTCKDLFYGHPHFHDGWYFVCPMIFYRIDRLKTYEIVKNRLVLDRSKFRNGRRFCIRLLQYDEYGRNVCLSRYSYDSNAKYTMEKGK